MIVLGGLDASGKSTICNGLKDYYNGEVTHFSNPKDLEDGKKQYFNFINKTELDKFYICDRYHDGEWVYAPIYRNYVADYMEELENEIIKKHNYLFVYVKAELNTIIERIKSRGEDFVKPEHYQTIMDNYENIYLMSQNMPFTVIDTTNGSIEHNVKKAIDDYSKVEKIWSIYKNCKRCDDITTPMSLPRGNIRAKYMIVGQNPAGKGKLDNNFLPMFTNDTKSKFLIDILKENGIYLDCWFTNIVNCSTKDNKVNKDQKNNCLSRLQLQIDLIKPQKIICLGNEAFSQINKLSNIENIQIIKVPHYSYIKRFNNNEDKIKEYKNLFK